MVIHRLYIRDKIDYMLQTFDFRDDDDLATLQPLVNEIYRDIYGGIPHYSSRFMYDTLEYMRDNLDAVSELRLTTSYPAVKHLFMRYITLPKIKDD